MRRKPSPALPPDPPPLTTVADLLPDPQNRRQHTERNLATIVEALRTVGAARSIVIDEDNTILAGNGVTEAATAAGLTQVRVIEADGQELIAIRRRNLTPEQKRQLAMYDNRTAELATWNAEQLTEDIKAGLDLKPFWTEAELALLLGQAVSPTWAGMPEFTQEDQLAWRTIRVHFTSQADFDAFKQAIGREDLSATTKFIWYPPQERIYTTDQRYVAEEEDDYAALPLTAEDDQGD